MERKAPKLIKFEDFNDVTEKIYERVPALTGIVWYRFLNPVREPDPENVKYNGPYIWPQQKGIPTRDTIIDTDDSLKDIGVFEVYDKNAGLIKTHRFTVPTNLTQGMFSIDPSNTEQLKFYTYFELCNYNASNPNRDTSKPAIFERIDQAKAAKNTNSRMKVKRDAINFVADASLDEMRTLCEALQWGESEADVMRAQLWEYAENNPEEFVKIAGNKNKLSIKSVIKQAVDANVITFDKLQNKVKLVKSGEVIATFDKSDTRDMAEMLYEYINTNTKGDSVLKTIKKLLNAVEA